MSSLTPRKVGVSTWISILSPSFIATFYFGCGEGENCGLCPHLIDIRTLVISPLVYLVHSFLDPVSSRCSVFMCIPHDEMVCRWDIGDMSGEQSGDTAAVQEKPGAHQHTLRMASAC